MAEWYEITTKHPGQLEQAVRFLKKNGDRVEEVNGRFRILIGNKYGQFRAPSFIKLKPWTGLDVIKELIPDRTKMALRLLEKKPAFSVTNNQCWICKKGCDSEGALLTHLEEHATEVTSLIIDTERSIQEGTAVLVEDEDMASPLQEKTTVPEDTTSLSDYHMLMSQEEDALIWNMYKAGLGSNEIGKHLIQFSPHRHYKSVNSAAASVKARHNVLSKPGRKAYTDELERMALESNKQGGVVVPKPAPAEPPKPPDPKPQESVDQSKWDGSKFVTSPENKSQQAISPTNQIIKDLESIRDRAFAEADIQLSIAADAERILHQIKPVIDLIETMKRSGLA